MIPQADYTYELYTAPKRLLIYDLDQGGKSLTNDMQQVLFSIIRQENIDLQQYRIAYRDSQGIFDEVRLDERGHISIHPIQTRHEQEALDFLKQNRAGINPEP